MALVRKGLVAEADPFLTTVGTLESGRRELRCPRDRANLALGYAYLQNNQPALAKPVLRARAYRRSVSPTRRCSAWAGRMRPKASSRRR